MSEDEKQFHKKEEEGLMKWRRRKGFKGGKDRVAFAKEDRRNSDANVTSWPQGAGGVDYAALAPFRPPPRDRNRRHCQSQSGGGECKEERERVRIIWQMGYITYKRTGCDTSPEHNFYFNITAAV